MKFYRKSKGETEHYSSFEELRDAWGLKPVIKQTKDKAKLEKQKEKFLNGHLCSACKKPLTYIGGNLLTCTNENCNGQKHEKILESGEKRIWYTTVYELLDDKGSEIAMNLFTDFTEN